MTFNSIPFIFIFLPVVLAVYYFAPSKGRNIVLLLASILFYAWGNPAHVLLLIFSVFFNYITAAQIEALSGEEKKKRRKLAFISGIAVNVALLAFYKYSGFLLDNLNALFHTDFQSGVNSLPIGISFFTFSAISYLADLYMGNAEYTANPMQFALYLMMFPKITSGPIVRFVDFQQQLRERLITKGRLAEGLQQFLIGLFKKVLLADNLALSFNAISSMTERSVGTAWLGMIFYGLQLYFDFSGYSDMAIGIAKMFGFHFEPNFNYPYLSDSVADFWRRWHISLGLWFRNYVYIPMGGNRCRVRRQVVNLLVVWLLTGLWHGASWNFVFWGLYHGAWIMFERFVLKDRRERIPHAARIGLTVLIVFLGWVFFFSPSLSASFTYFGQMVGTAHLGFLDDTALYYLGSNLILLILCVICCGPWLNRWFSLRRYRSSQIASYVTLGVYVFLFFCSVANIVGSTYSTFLYAAF